jgi:Uncharacterised nucleotidyltransferase
MKKRNHRLTVFRWRSGSNLRVMADSRAKFPTELFAELEYRAHVTRVDRATAELVTAFREHGIASILLKGPATARVLYPSELRLYNDVDLLVVPSQFDAATEVAAGLGFERRTPVPSGKLKRAVHVGLESEERALDRVSDGVTLDLHRSFHGLPVEFDLHSFLAMDAETMLICDVEVPVPDAAGVALIVTLHASNAKLPLANTQRLVTDVTRCLDTFTEREWSDLSLRSLELGVDRVVVSVLRECGGVRGAVVCDERFSDTKPNRLVSAHLQNGSVIAFYVWLLSTYSLRRRIAWTASRLAKLIRRVLL